MKRLPIILVAGLAVSACLGLSGCIAVWDSGYHIEAHSRSSITIKFDPLASDLAEITKVAKSYCAQGRLNAVNRGAAKTSVYGLQTVVFDCVPAPFVPYP